VSPRLDGFRYTPDAPSDGIHGRAARHAAAQILGPELAERAEALAAAADDAISLSSNGRILWAGSEIARLERGDSALKPRIHLYADEHLGQPERERVLQRLETWFGAHLATRIKPLVALSEATDLAGLARGLAFRLSENLGVLRRDAVADDIKALNQGARAQLRGYGVRFGAFNIYIPALLKPAAAELLLLLWALYAGREHGIDSDTVPARPQQGLTSIEADRRTPEPYWHAAGFQLVGARAVRIDMLERLSDLIRSRLMWRATSGGTAPPGAMGDESFRVVPELMSVVGCSGEDFASILTALGFRRSRRGLPPASLGTQQGGEATNPIGAEAGEPAPAAIADDEVWRPGRRKDAHRGGRNRAKQTTPRAGKKPAPPPREEKPAAKVRHERPASNEHSPFAALKDLRRSLVARRQGG
jgi:ATP-dependent RNA helicase SUPV3L1/SUV3